MTAALDVKSVIKQTFMHRNTETQKQGKTQFSDALGEKHCHMIKKLICWLFAMPKKMKTWILAVGKKAPSNVTVYNTKISIPLTEII